MPVKIGGLLAPYAPFRAQKTHYREPAIPAIPFPRAVVVFFSPSCGKTTAAGWAQRMRYCRRQCFPSNGADARHRIVRSLSRFIPCELPEVYRSSDNRQDSSKPRTASDGGPSGSEVEIPVFGNSG